MISSTIILLLFLIFLAGLVLINSNRDPKLKQLGRLFLALVALFMGGCSLFYLSFTLECLFTDQGTECGVAFFVLIIAVPVLIVALLLGWLTWRSFKESRYSHEDSRLHRKPKENTVAFKRGARVSSFSEE